MKSYSLNIGMIFFFFKVIKCPITAKVSSTWQDSAHRRDDLLGSKTNIWQNPRKFCTFRLNPRDRQVYIQRQYTVTVNLCNQRVPSLTEVGLPSWSGNLPHTWVSVHKQTFWKTSHKKDQLASCTCTILWCTRAEGRKKKERKKFRRFPRLG